MQNSFTLPPNGRITKIAINGVERKIDPPIPFSSDDVITIPHDDIQQDIEITPASDDHTVLTITAQAECTNCQKKPSSGFLHFVGNDEFLCTDCVKKKYSLL